MREPAPDYSSRHYERPNQALVCGLASEGHACLAGPTARGQCPALAECVPAREGDRWQCNRSPLRGGACAEGPSPDGDCGRVHRCQPVRSLRAVRGRFVTACTLLALGGLFILLSADWRNAAISPGPLTRQHAQLLENDLAEPNCAACHAAAERSAAGWTASLAIGHGGRHEQWQRCMNCHDKTISTQFALAAHNLPPDVLQELTTAATTTAATKQFACSACHREHHGAQFDLTAMNNDACQGCHQRRYESFSTDHPDFGAWPYKRRTRIAFNHASHQVKHFTEKKQAFDCRACHVEDATGQVQLLASYETACASCHDDKIATSVAKGVPMIALPTLDIDALKEAGHDVGPWPEAATGDFDGRLPPMMKLLLAADPDAAQAMATLGSDFDFFDVDPDAPEQLKACATLAVAIKKLLAELSDSGPAAVRDRLQVVSGHHITNAQLNPLLAGLSTETVRSAVKSWLPDIAPGGKLSPRSGVSMSGGGPDMPTPTSGEGMPPKRQTTRPIAFDPAGAWTRDDATLSIRYRPAAHADPVLAGWLELLAATPGLAQRPLAHAMFRELSNPTAPGLCASCHSVEQTGAGLLTINWRAYDRTSEPRSLTKFSHGPHLLLPQLANCTHCHPIDESRNAADSYADWNPQRFVSEFAPVSKQQCVDCHTAKAAGDHCQQCHNYHVDGIENWRLNAIADCGFRISD